MREQRFERTVPRRLPTSGPLTVPSVKVIHQRIKGGGAVPTPASLPLPARTCASSTPTIGWTVAPRTRCSISCARSYKARRHLDLLVTNYVYDKREGPTRPSSVTASLPRGRTFGWADLHATSTLMMRT